MDNLIDQIVTLFKNENIKLRDFKEVIALWRTWELTLKKEDLGDLQGFTDLKHNEYNVKVYL